jgi:hypothetical protein
MLKKVNVVFGKGPKPKQDPKPQQDSKSKKRRHERLGKEISTDDVGETNAKNAKKEKPVKIWKKKSVFWELEYWIDLDVRHYIDLMHVEKNVCDNILGTLQNIKGK